MNPGDDGLLERRSKRRNRPFSKEGEEVGKRMDGAEEKR